MKRRILVVDIGGSFVKLLMSERVEREFASGPRMTPKQFLTKFKETVRGWKFDVASIGFPAPVRNGRILRNPKHLGKDWVHFDFARALGLPVRIVNEAAMHAIVSNRVLCRPWRRPGASVRSTAEGNRARAKLKRVPRWHSFMGNETQFSRVEVAAVVAEISDGTFSDVRRSSSQEN